MQNNMCFASKFPHLRTENGNTQFIALWDRRQISLLILNEFKQIK